MSMGNGSGKKTVSLLETLVAEVCGVRGDMRIGFESVNQRIDGVNERIDGVNARLDGVLHLVGGHHRDLEARVARIEEHLGFKKS